MSTVTLQMLPKLGNGIAEAYSEPCQTSKMECFATQLTAVLLITINYCFRNDYGFVDLKFHLLR